MWGRTGHAAGPALLALTAAGCFGPVSLSSEQDDRTEPLVVSGGGCTEIDPWTGETFVALAYYPVGEVRDYHTYVTPDADGNWSYTFRFDGWLPPPAGHYTVAAQCNWDNEPYGDGSFVLTPGDNPEIDGQLVVSDTTVSPGQTVSITGDRFLGTVTAGVFLYPSQTHLANVRPGADDVLRATVTIPAGTPPGQHRIIAEGWGPPGGTVRSDGTIDLTISPIWTYAADITVVG
jgi:hypothetical protein